MSLPFCHNANSKTIYALNPKTSFWNHGRTPVTGERYFLSPPNSACILTFHYLKSDSSGRNVTHHHDYFFALKSFQGQQATLGFPWFWPAVKNTSGHSLTMPALNSFSSIIQDREISSFATVRAFEQQTVVFNSKLFGFHERCILFIFRSWLSIFFYGICFKLKIYPGPLYESTRT